MLAHARRLRKSETWCRNGMAMEQAMAYTLDEFCTQTRAILKNEPMSDALGHIAERLGRLLSNPAFVAETFSDDMRSEEHTSELQSLRHLVCRLLLEKK